jgi:hypothetical protein
MTELALARSPSLCSDDKRYPSNPPDPLAAICERLLSSLQTPGPGEHELDMHKSDYFRIAPDKQA